MTEGYNQPMRWVALLVAAGTLAAPAAPRRDATLAARIDSLVKPTGADVAVVFGNVESDPELTLRADESFHAASTMKVPVMIELFRQADAGTLSLDEPLPIRNEFHSIVDGSVYQLDVADDSDTLVYKAIGTTMTLRQLCDAMITVSSNFAANLLIERLGVQNIRATVSKLGADGMNVLRGVEDGKAFAKGLNNTTTARALFTLLQAIAHGKAVSPRADAEMIAVLKRQTFNDGIPAGLPPGTAVAHKTGNITKIYHDAAIVYGSHPYVLVVLVRGIEDPKQSTGLIAAISREVWTAVNSR
jgi:beta-lactamase class A